MNAAQGKSGPVSRTKTYDLAVIGLGYVGLPLAREATRVGLTVVGFDLSQRIVAQLSDGRSHVRDISNDDVAKMVADGFRPTSDPSVMADADVVIICVPTPLDESGQPDLGPVLSAAQVLAQHLTRGTLVVLESTTYPGTTDELLLPVLERGGLRAGLDFYLAFSPERIDPGNRIWGLRNTPKVVGGYTPECGDRAEIFYAKMVDTVVRARGTREAELAKLIENTYRHVNIALANEIALVSQDLGVDVWNAIDCAATKPFGFHPFYPSAGVGGHCIPVDPNYLAYKVRTMGHHFRFVTLANEINGRMPLHVVERVTTMLNDVGRAVRGSRILLLGVAYKPNVNDDRGSPARTIMRRLHSLGAEISYHDPYFATWDYGAGQPLQGVDDLTLAITSSDLTVVLQPHDEYSVDILRHASNLLDASGRFDFPGLQRLWTSD